MGSWEISNVRREMTLSSSKSQSEHFRMDSKTDRQSMPGSENQTHVSEGGSQLHEQPFQLRLLKPNFKKATSYYLLKINN